MDQHFSWVKAQHSCSPVEVFQVLEDQCSQDVEDWIALQDHTPSILFKVSLQGNKFLVMREAGAVRSSIQFEWSDDGITVRDQTGRVMLEAQPVLNFDGNCRLKVDADDLTFWQFRRRALKDFFFNFEP